MNGPAPLPWDIPLYASEKFKTEKKKLEVPHTACVKACDSSALIVFLIYTPVVVQKIAALLLKIKLGHCGVYQEI